MAKPTILTVDDEQEVLNAVTRDLHRRYSKDYRIIKTGSGKEALETLRELKAREEPVALLLVDQRMPEQTGIEFLREARKIFPKARKVLLTAYADTAAAIASINEVGLDYYLKKPWEPPEENLFPVLDDLLDEWWVDAPTPYSGIRICGTLWSPSSHRVKDFLSRNRIPYRWLDIELNPEATSLVGDLKLGPGRLPVVFMPDGQTLYNPSNGELAQAIGMRMEASERFYDLIIVGGGPSGLGAAVYGGSEGLVTLLIDRVSTGGQAGTSTRIENYLGFPRGLSGADLARRATAQARRFGVEVLTPQEVLSVRLEDGYKILTLGSGAEVCCKALLIATGVTVRRLALEGIKKFEGAGVYYGAAMTEASSYRGESISVVGGGNSAGQGAMFFSRYARQVTLLVRGSALVRGMSQYLVDQIRATSNIHVITRSEVVGVLGKKKLTGLVVKDQDSGQTREIATAALFPFIGAVAHTEMLAGLVERNRQGFILTGLDLLKNGRIMGGWRLERQPFVLETNVPGIFAAGDVRQGSVKRVASAVGEGAIAVSLVHQYLRTV